jgi:serine protease
MSANHFFKVLASTAVVSTFSFIALAQSATAPAFQSPAPNQQGAPRPGSAVRMNRLIVKFRDESGGKNLALGVASGPERVNALNTTLRPVMASGMRPTLSYLKSVSAHTHVAQTSQAMSHAELKALAQAVAQDPRVEYAEVDERVYPHFVPNDPLYASRQYNLKSPVVEISGANLPNAWGRTTAGVPVSGAGVTVAVLDTGYLLHADLAATTSSARTASTTSRPPMTAMDATPTRWTPVTGTRRPACAMSPTRPGTAPM